MPRVYPEDQPEEKPKSGPCDSVREDLKLCLLSTDCVKERKLKVKQCFDTGQIPDECVQLRTLMFECKRSLLDNRLRFRGRKDY